MTLDHNSLSGICTGDLTGSGGLSGGLDVITTPGGTTVVDFLPYAPVGGGAVPEPSTMLLLGSGLAGLVALRKRFSKA